MTREEQLAYREERAEAAMFHICRDLYEIDVPNHPVKDGYRIGFNEGVEYAKKILIDKACEWISQSYTFGVLDWKNCDSIIEVIERHIKNKFFNKEYLKQ